MVSHFVYILLERLLWIAAMGIGQFIYNYQTLITGVLAVGAAYMANGLVTLAGSRMYTSMADTDEVIDNAINRFENVLKECHA